MSAAFEIDNPFAMSDEEFDAYTQRTRKYSKVRTYRKYDVIGKYGDDEITFNSLRFSDAKRTSAELHSQGYTVSIIEVASKRQLIQKPFAPAMQIVKPTVIPQPTDAIQHTIAWEVINQIDSHNRVIPQSDVVFTYRPLSKHSERKAKERAERKYYAKLMKDNGKANEERMVSVFIKSQMLIRANLITVYNWLQDENNYRPHNRKSLHIALES